MRFRVALVGLAIVVAAGLPLPGRDPGGPVGRTALAAPGTRPSNCAAPVVSTTSGRFCGLLKQIDSAGEVRAYLGIPYAESTAGENRWAPPKPTTARPDVIEALAFGPSCPQSNQDPPAGYSPSEDCLSVNVWTPVQTEPPAEGDLPVMVFIYGGAFVDGNSANPVYDGSRIAAMGRVVVVSLNYRLGALGFLAGIEGLSGNYGFMDQQLALRWVRANIGRFGGDPDKVTLFGESAGAMSVGLHLVAPGSRGLFRAAIMESNPYGIPYKTLRDAATFSKTLQDKLGCRLSGLGCLRKKSFRDIVQHQESKHLKFESMFSGFSGYLIWAPVIDGTLIPKQPLEEPIRLPTLIGTNTNEGLLFATAFEKHEKGGKTKVPRFRYDLELDLVFPIRNARKIRHRSAYKPHRGDNTDELSRLMTDYIFTCANRRVMMRSTAPVYAYQFTQVPSFATWPKVPLCASDRDVVCHAAELPFVFGNPHSASWHRGSEQVEFTRAERRLSSEMIAYWTHFAATLDPNHRGAARWPRFTTSEPVRFILNATLSQERDLDANCGFWDSIGYDLKRTLHPVDETEASSLVQANPFSQCAEFTETRRAFFGDLHIHTTDSLDANLEGTRLTPHQAYRFAQGFPVTLPKVLKTVRIDRPLDFVAVTDHAEFFGFLGVCNDRESGKYRKKGCRIYRRRPDWGLLIIDKHLSQENHFHQPPRACGKDADYCYPYREKKWREIQDAAERNYDRSDQCRFATFIGYEWSASPAHGVVHVGKVHNMHRNVIFRNASVPRVPIDFFDAAQVQHLWAGLKEKCLDAGTGCDVLAIPHNANLSAGRMFSDLIFEHKKSETPPITAEYAKAQAAMEPLMEIYQHKGSSECLPGQTAADESCGFEVIPYDNLRSAKEDKEVPVNDADTMRYGLGEGMRLGEELGTNPFQFGIISSTDNHLGIAGNTNEATFLGGGGAGEIHLGDDVTEFPDRVFFGGGGLAGVWAEENSREALFLALRRKETFGTSGTRLTARMFGGWSFPKGWCELPDRDRVAYKRGIPMGGDLTSPPSSNARIVLAIEAVADRGTPQYPGAKLQRIQVIKGYLDDDGVAQTRVFDVAGDATRGQDLDLETCEPSSDGFESLCTTWRDETFRPEQRAYYYVRVMEVPTCRWSTRMCVSANYDCENQTRKIDKQCCEYRAGLNPHHCGRVTCDKAQLDDPCCKPGVVQPVIHERAWTSPIWYTPSTPYNLGH